jgi:hypothetical protein
VRTLNVAWVFYVCLESVSVQDFVRVTLLGQEALAVLGKVLIHGVSGDQRVEAGGSAICLWSQQAAKALGFFLT